MTNITKLIAAATLISASGAALAFGHDSTMAADNGLECEIVRTVNGNMLMLEGVAHAETATSGKYSFAVKGGGMAGTTNIRQGGAFSAEAGDSVTLGKMMLSAGGTYDVQFEIDANGATLDCHDAGAGTI